MKLKIEGSHAFIVMSKRKKVSVDIFSQNQKDFYSALNRLVEIFDVDNVSNVKGKLFYNDYYIECNIFKNQKDMKSYILPYAKVDLTLVTDSTKWIKEDTYHFTAQVKAEKQEQRSIPINTLTCMVQVKDR